GDGVQRARGAHELQYLLADAVHVDRERNAAEADERNAKFLLAHDEVLAGDSQPLPGSCREMAATGSHFSVIPWWSRYRSRPAESRPPPAPRKSPRHGSGRGSRR